MSVTPTEHRGRVSLYRRALAEVKQFIARHGLRPGDALPPEGALATTLGMSRLSLREAMKGLESLGIVEARHGNGVYVRPFSFQPILDNLPYWLAVDGRALGHLLQVREALEVGLVGMAVERLDAHDVAALERLALDMQAHVRRGVSHLEVDREFHRHLYSTLDNPLVPRLIDLFWEAFQRLYQQVITTPPDAARLHGIHHAIVEAARARDPERARRAIVDHFAMMRERVALFREVHEAAS